MLHFLSLMLCFLACSLHSVYLQQLKSIPCSASLEYIIALPACKYHGQGPHPSTPSVVPSLCATSACKTCTPQTNDLITRLASKLHVHATLIMSHISFASMSASSPPRPCTHGIHNIITFCPYASALHSNEVSILFLMSCCTHAQAFHTKHILTSPAPLPMHTSFLVAYCAAMMFRYSCFPVELLSSSL